MQHSVAMDMKIAENAKKEKKPWRETVPKIYHKFHTVFEKTEFDQLSERGPWDHAIEFKEGTNEEKLRKRAYQLSPLEMKVLDEFLDENLKTIRLGLSMRTKTN